MYLVDIGYLSWKIAANIQYGGSPTQLCDSIADNAIFCCDSGTSLRQLTYPSYKSNRVALPEATQKLGALAYEWRTKARKRYDFRYKDGLEADDLCAMWAAMEPNQAILSGDKDYLQIIGDTLLVGADLLPWGIERMQKKTSHQLAVGERFLAYQLLYGDTGDGIPRAIPSKDRTTAPYCFSQPSPLVAAIEMLPESMVVERLNLLMLPTPLITGSNPIDEVLRRYSLSPT
jgi:hypothetical protein